MQAGFGATARAASMALEMPAPAAVVGGWTESPSTLRLPTGPFVAGKMPLREAAGVVSLRAYRMDDQRQTTLQLITPLMDQLQRASYTTLFQCEASACGGFDFRYGMEVLPEPQMHVDLGDFRYVVAQRPTRQGADLIALLVSRSDDASYVQVTTIAPPAAGTVAPTTPVMRSTIAESQPPASQTPVSQAPDNQKPGAAKVGAPALGTQAADSTAADGLAPGTRLTDPAQGVARPALTPDALGQALTAGGSVALDDLLFPSGNAALEDGDYASLNALAQWLGANPGQHVVLVGHTDASGGLAANTTLSRQRAQSVRATMITKLGADPKRIDAQGAGYLAPRASNATPEGRAQNRRVEVMLTPTP